MPVNEEKPALCVELRVYSEPILHALAKALVDV